MKKKYIFILTFLLSAFTPGEASPADSLAVQTGDSTLSGNEILLSGEINAFGDNQQPLFGTLRMGRDFSRVWFLSDGLGELPFGEKYGYGYRFDPYNPSRDLSLYPPDDKDIAFSNGELSINIDSLKSNIPYTHLHYQTGSYGYLNLFVRFRQRLGNWLMDLHGRNEYGDDGHTYNDGNRVNFTGLVRYYLSEASYWEINYRVKRKRYNYWPLERDTTILFPAVDHSAMDQWSLVKGWRSRGGETRSGIQYFSRGGSWTGSKENYDPYDYKNVRLFFQKRQSLCNRNFSVFASLGYNWGKIRGSGEYSEREDMKNISGVLRGEYTAEINADLLISGKARALYVNEKFSGAIDFSMDYGDHFGITGGGELYLLPDVYGVLGNNSGGRWYGDFEYRLKEKNLWKLSFLLRSVRYTGLDKYPGGSLEKDENAFLFVTRASFKKWIVGAEVDYQYRISGFSFLPQHFGSFSLDLNFPVIGKMSFAGKGTILFAEKYTPFDFDLIHNFLTPGSDSGYGNWQLNVRAAARFPDFEIYYLGTHLDAFLLDGNDFSWVRRFPDNLPRYRIGVSWILWN